MKDSKKHSEPGELSDESPETNEIHAETEETSFDSAKSNPKQVSITDVELKNMQKELMEYKDKYLRTLAEGENSRKRMQKECTDKIKYAVENLIVDFLNPLDNLENALAFSQNMSEEVKNWAFGFQMILNQFKDILTENGVQPIVSVGNLFNPHCHEAVEIFETREKPPGTIIEEYVRGYKMGDRTIRPARVKVTRVNETDNTVDSADEKESYE